MAQLPTHRSPTISPPSSPKLPYDKHPIYNLRKWLIIIALIGCLLSLLSYAPYQSRPTGFNLLFLSISTVFALSDLTAYAMHKLQQPNKDPEGPRKVTMVFDVVLAVLLQLLFWGSMGEFATSYYVDVMASYAALTAFICSLLHAYSFWKQLMARYKEKWLSSIVQEPCARCGYVEVPGEATATRHASCTPHNTFTYAGPSATSQGSTIITPGATESNMEEGLLIGSEYRDDPGEPTIDQEEQVVVTKSKKKKVLSKAKLEDEVDESYRNGVRAVEARSSSS